MNGATLGIWPVPWLRIIAIWLGVGIINACEIVFPMRAVGMHHHWGRLFLVLVIDWLPWALATPLVMRVARQHRLSTTPSSRTAAIHLCLLVAIAVATAAWSALLDISLDPWAQAPPANSYVSLSVTKLSYDLLTSLIVYAFIQSITFVMDSATRIARRDTETARLNEQLAKAQLDALRRQIDPHSMFNTFSAISGLVRDHQIEGAISMIAGLSSLLRRSARDNDRPRVTLGEEIEYLQEFLEIQRVRFIDRLQVNLDVPTDLHSLLVPNLILQPLVENAIKHGIATRIEGGRIEIVARRDGEGLQLRVFNDGPGLAHDRAAVSPGIGLANLRARLKILYGDHFGLNIASPDSGGVEVTMSLPLETPQ
jgi:two-component system LytT family sensor kinase